MVKTKRRAAALVAVAQVALALVALAAPEISEAGTAPGAIPAQEVEEVVRIRTATTSPRAAESFPFASRDCRARALALIRRARVVYISLYEVVGGRG